MKKGAKNKEEIPHNSFDRIFKEILAEAVDELFKAAFNIELKNSRILNVEIKITNEKEPDFLVASMEGEAIEKAYHLELQTHSDPEMAARNLIYQGFIFKRFKTVAEQIVLYLGVDEPKFKTQIETENLTFQYKVVALKDIDPEVFLQSDHPATVILSLLCKTTELDASLDKVLNRLKELSVDELALKRYINQLLVCSYLRKFDDKIIQRFQAMPIVIDNFKDSYFYQYVVEEERHKWEAKGEAEGEAKGEAHLIRKSHQKMGFTESQLAEMFDLPLDFIKKALNNEI